MYLNPEKTSAGNYPALQSNQAPGLVLFPDDFISVFYQQDKRFSGFVHVTISNGEVTSCTWDSSAYDAYCADHPEHTDSPAELREKAYDTQPIISWDGSMLTVTEAAQLWQYYAAEGNTAKTDELTALIAEAKASIREQYPDEEGGA